MKKAFGLIFTLALLASTAHAATADPIGSSKTPEQVVDLYLASAWGDMDKAKELSDYLLPHYVGKDKSDFLPSVQKIKKFIDHYSNLFSPNAKPDTNMDPDKMVFLVAFMAPFLHTTCHATGSTIHAGDNGSSPVATVAYECHMPNVKKVIAILPPWLSQRAEPVKELSRKEVDRMIAAINALPADMVVTDTVNLNADTAHHIWFGGGLPLNGTDHELLHNAIQVFEKIDPFIDFR